LSWKLGALEYLWAGMAMTRDSTVTMAGTSAAARTGSSSASSKGIVLAGDRTPNRAAAQSHTRTVRLLKATLPLAGLAISGVYGLSVMKTMGWGAGIPALEIPNIMPENLAMNNPHYEGFNKDGGRYWVKAATAQQDLKNLSLIKLNTITGEMTDAKKAVTTLTATRGTFDNKANQLELYDSIDVAGDAGMKAHLTRASIQTKESIITSNEPVLVMMEAGTINANTMTARQKVKEYTFVEKVRTHLNAREKGPENASETEPAKAPADQLFGKSDAPVDITSNRLDINDATKIALFTGIVTAVQDGASLTTPELEVSYEGSAAPQSGTESTGSKVKRMTAKNPVVLKQANGDTVTSQNADFDAVTERAVLEGGVVMSQLPDKRATADKAEIDQSANTVLLTGTDVVVTQGQNILKGRRLLFNRGTNKMQLTSPGASNASGRISAHFQQQAQAGAAPAAPKAEAPAQGIAFGASFKTTPGAPVLIDAARLDVDDAAKQAVFTGDVHAVQGDFVIRAAELVANYTGSTGLSGATNAADPTKNSAAQLTHIKARTKVEITSKDGQNAKGDWADFDPKANMATLGGNVILTQGKNVVRGTKLVIDMTTGESVIQNEAPATNSATTIAPDGTATAATSATSAGGRPSATFYIDDIKSRAPKVPGKPAASSWQAETAPSAPR
jgi:lipopolysaccharide transport protein LptA/LPS export ABC transporter protein LptC